jgi:glycosyltransferase involved in cell wall biosynthesis
MMNKPLVSVIIPTYNQKDFVSETLESVLAQTYSNLEIIVTDDGSTDGTVDILNEYASKYPTKIKLIVNNKNEGITKNFNRGLNAVNGEFIAWLGGDDLMLPDKIKKQVELLISRPDAAGCVHEAEVFESDSGKVIGLFSEIYNGKKGFKEGGVELWFEPGYLMLPSTEMFRSALRPIQGLDERLLFGDWLYDIEVFRHGNCAVLNEVLGKYRRHPQNITSNSIAKNKGFEETLIVLAVIDSKYPELHTLVKKTRISSYIAVAGLSFKNGDIKRSNAYVKILIYEGAIISAVTTFIALRFFSKYISSQLAKDRHQRSRLFTRLSRILQRGI